MVASLGNLCPSTSTRKTKWGPSLCRREFLLAGDPTIPFSKAAASPSQLVQGFARHLSASEGEWQRCASSPRHSRSKALHNEPSRYFTNL